MKKPRRIETIVAARKSNRRKFSFMDSPLQEDFRTISTEDNRINEDPEG
jgi:hypothetical protein